MAVGDDPPVRGWSWLWAWWPFGVPRARREARRALDQTRVTLSQTLTMLAETEQPALRSQVIARAGVLYSSLGDGLEAAFGPAAVERARAARAAAAFLRALAAAEFSRSSGRVRRAADWADLERAVGGALNQLADVTLVKAQELGNVYALVCAQAEAVLPTPFRDEVFAAVRRAYESPSSEGW